ncbi:hypothetical protein Tco_0397032 [Tanacetum coccineum]
MRRSSNVVMGKKGCFSWSLGLWNLEQTVVMPLSGNNRIGFRESFEAFWSMREVEKWYFRVASFQLYPIVDASLSTLVTNRKTSSAIPIGSEIDRSANSSVMQVGVSSGRERFFQTEYGIRLMLAPRSAKALHVLIPENSQGMRNRPGSPSFFAFSRRLSSFLLEGNGIDAFWLGLEALTGAFAGSEIDS